MSTPAESMPRDRLKSVVEHLEAHGVEFMIIGGMAEGLFGSPRVTYDIDLCYQRTEGNLKRLAAALVELHPKLRGAPPDLPFKVDERSLALGSNFTFTTTAGDLDLLGYVEPIGMYDDLLAHAETVDFHGRKVKVIGLEDLIKVKQHIRRPKDQESLMQLLGIRRVRAEGGG